VLSPAYVIDQPEPGLHRTGRAATSQRVVSQRAPSLSPSQSTFSYGAPSPPIGSDIEAEYPAARLSVFLPHPAAASACPVAAGVNVGRTSLPYASVDTRWPGSAAAGPRLLEPATSLFAGTPSAAVAHPGSHDVASSRTRVRSDTPMPSSDVGQRMRVDVSRPLDLTLSTASDDVLPGNVDVAGLAYDPPHLLYSTLRVHLAHRQLSRLGLLMPVFIGLCLLWLYAHPSRRCR